jgi:hypothetical protein
VRYTQVALAALGVAASAAVTVMASAGGATGVYATAPGFYAAGAALVGLGLVGLALAWRERRGAAMALVLAAVVGFLAWPYALAAALFLAAALVSLAGSASRPGSDRLLRVALAVAVLLCLATIALLLLRSFSYPLAGAFAALAALVAAAAELTRPRRARPASARP